MAELARLALSDEEVQAVQRELDAILDYMAELDALDVSEVAPTFHSIPMVAPQREDVVLPCISRNEILAEAPSSEAGAFAVPQVLEGDG